MSEQKLSEKCANKCVRVQEERWCLMGQIVPEAELAQIIARETNCDTLAQQLADSRKECGELVSVLKQIGTIYVFPSSLMAQIKAALSKYQGKEGEK